MTLDQQDEVTANIIAIWPDAEVIDRRLEPMHGYRAVHIVPRIDKCLVEIQLRTIHQDLWAQGMETWGDKWGRDVRYGGPPVEPDAPVGASGDMTRAQLIEQWKELSDRLYRMARVENMMAQLRAAPLDERGQAELASLETEAETGFGPLRATINAVRDVFSTLS
jgi:hypothetical protein